MISGNRDYLLMELLGCGSLDLRLVDAVGYDWCDVISDEVAEHIVSSKRNGVVGVNILMRAVVEYGIQQIEEAVDDRICELEAIPNERELDENEEAELKALMALNPDEDIQSYHNCIDTYVRFEQNAEVYREYMSDALDDFAEGTGFQIKF